jgi:hypothetical protein
LLVGRGRIGDEGIHGRCRLGLVGVDLWLGVREEGVLGLDGERVHLGLLGDLGGELKDGLLRGELGERLEGILLRVQLLLHLCLLLLLLLELLLLELDLLLLLHLELLLLLHLELLLLL